MAASYHHVKSQKIARIRGAEATEREPYKTYGERIVARRNKEDEMIL